LDIHNQDVETGFHQIEGMSEGETADVAQPTVSETFRWPFWTIIVGAEEITIQDLLMQDLVSRKLWRKASDARSDFTIALAKIR
jgi:hypothetical protein